MRRSALVTGAGRGIGRAIAESLSADGDVGFMDVAFDGDNGGIQIEADVSDREAVREGVEDFAQQYGGIDRVVCAAGIIRDRMSWKMTDDDWDAVISVNLTGAFNVVRAALPHVRKSGQGRVVFISSINAVRGNLGQANYAAAKAGMIGLTRTLARELARDRATVNAVLPGYIDTEMTRGLPEEARQRAIARTPLGRLGSVTDIASAVRFLCSDEAGFITGVALPVDGGQLMGAFG